MPRNLERTIRFYPHTSIYTYTPRPRLSLNLRFFTTTSTSPSTMAPIERITLFKVPKEEDRQRILEQYKVLAKTATKVS